MAAPYNGFLTAMALNAMLVRVLLLNPYPSAGRSQEMEEN
jgi:hypothetical protein